MKASELLKEAEIVDSIPSDILEENHREEPKKKQTRGRKPQDKYAKLQKQLEQAMAIPVMAFTLRGQAEDAMVLADHGESLPKRLVDVARQYEWFYKILNTLINGAMAGSAVGALIFEVVIIGIKLANNHGYNYKLPGILSTT